MNTVSSTALRTQLLNRRERLQTAIAANEESSHLVRLLSEVDLALQKMENGTYGICETCLDTIEADRLIMDPLVRNCLDHLSSDERTALEHDLDLAFQVQAALLPKPDLTVDGWTVARHYEPAGPVSGDYCDLILPENEPGSLYFLVGDVSGKGVAASILMSHLHAIFRSLITAGAPLNQLVERANRIFSQGTMGTHFATLVCGRADASGEVEICNAGHCFPLLTRGDEVIPLPSTDLPLGLFHEGKFTSHKVRLARAESLLLYTDGLTEARNQSGELYGEERLAKLVRTKRTSSPRELIGAFLEDLGDFRLGAPKTDDLTLMVLNRAA
jgi:sigma-B regulation protein RsbU (phosphoserine phosphatase)